MNKLTVSHIVSALILALGLIAASLIGKQAVIQAKNAERFVTVKGLASKEVRANLGAWGIEYQEVGNNLAQLNTQLAQDQQTALAFLMKNGFTQNEISLKSTKLVDQLANNNQPAMPNNTGTNNRYILSGGFYIRSTKVDQIKKVSQMTGELIKEGVPLSFGYTSDPQYFYTALDSIRPEMLSAATQSAKLVAIQFARDSNSQLGTIRRANQGVFELRSRDSSNSDNVNSSIDQTVRLVTTIDFYLKQ